MRHRSILTAFLTSFLLEASPVLAVIEGPPASEFGIEAIDHRGSGCRPGTVASNIAPDAKAFTLIFSDYLVDSSTRGGRPARRACDLDLRLRVPAGWSFAVFGVQVRGYAALQGGAVGVVKALASMGRMVPQEIGRQRLEGPYDDNFALFTDLPLEQVEWSPCGRERQRRFNLKTAMVVRPRRGFGDGAGEVDDPSLGAGFPVGTLSMDSLDGVIEHRYGIAWRRCDAGEGGEGPERATCTITLGGRTFTEGGRGPTAGRAKLRATEKVVQACALALGGRPAAGSCRPERAVCVFGH